MGSESMSVDRSYDIWDIGTGNLVATFDAEAAALALIRDAVASYGRRYVSRWALQVSGERGTIEVTAQGAALAKLAMQSVPT
jgi:hypothetical protein